MNVHSPEFHRSIVQSNVIADQFRSALKFAATAAGDQLCNNQSEAGLRSVTDAAIARSMRLRLREVDRLRTTMDELRAAMTEIREPSTPDERREADWRDIGSLQESLRRECAVLGIGLGPSA